MFEVASNDDLIYSIFIFSFFLLNFDNYMGIRWFIDVDYIIGKLV